MMWAAAGVSLTLSKPQQAPLPTLHRYQNVLACPSVCSFLLLSDHLALIKCSQTGSAQHLPSLEGPGTER